jgi:hypothetical protein
LLFSPPNRSSHQQDMEARAWLTNVGAKWRGMAGEGPAYTWWERLIRRMGRHVQVGEGIAPGERESEFHFLGGWIMVHRSMESRYL